MIATSWISTGALPRCVVGCRHGKLVFDLANFALPPGQLAMLTFPRKMRCAANPARALPNLPPLSTYCVRPEPRRHPATGMTRLCRYDGPLHHPKMPGQSVTGARLVAPVWVVGATCASSVSRPAQRSPGLRPAQACPNQSLALSF